MENEENIRVKRTDLKSLNRSELNQFLEEIGLASYRSNQVFQWLYHKGVSGFSEMTNLSKDLRKKLSDLAEIRRINEYSRQESQDGTGKSLVQLDDPQESKAEAV